MLPRRRQLRVSRLRFVTQALCFVFFVYAGMWGLNRITVGGREATLPTLSCEFVEYKVIRCYLLDLQTALTEGAAYGYARLIEPTVFFLLFCLLLGRAWCGWICPLGFVQDCIGSVRAAAGLGHRPLGPSAKQWLARTAYALLGLTVFLSFFSGRPESRLYPPAALQLADGMAGAVGVTVQKCRFCLPGEPSAGHKQSGCCPQCQVATTGTVAVAATGSGATDWQESLLTPYCQVCPAFQLLPLAQGNTANLLAINRANPAGWAMGLLAAAALAALVVGTPITRRFWCRLCAMGILLRLLRVNRWSLLGLRKDVRRCTYCGACERACPVDIVEVFRRRSGEKIRLPACHLCLKCVEACGEDNVLEARWGGAPIFCSRFDYVFGMKYGTFDTHIPIRDNRFGC
ncbi:MAG: 4Fe-4S binding protein [Candidatus Sumerlaeia bacterium]|nr:4Fe-4S binding protein [Candidatus Sumerlaeia bacterium]